MEFLWIIAALLVPVLAYILFLVICSLFISPRKEYNKHSQFYRVLINQFTWICLKAARIRVHVDGMEKVPTGTRRLLFVGNHRSNFDPLVTWYVFKEWQMAFISKPSNFKIPIFGRIIRKCCFMAIDRENPRNAIKTINRAADLLSREEVSVGVYPEGTRSKSCVLLPFHNGVFKIAQKANAPVAVLSIEGTEKVHKNYPLHPTDVYLTVLDVLSAEEVKQSKTDVTGNRVRALLENKLG